MSGTWQTGIPNIPWISGRVRLGTAPHLGQQLSREGRLSVENASVDEHRC